MNYRSFCIKQQNKKLFIMMMKSLLLILLITHIWCKYTPYWKFVRHSLYDDNPFDMGFNFDSSLFHFVSNPWSIYPDSQLTQFNLNTKQQVNVPCGWDIMTLKYFNKDNKYFEQLSYTSETMGKLIPLFAIGQDDLQITAHGQRNLLDLAPDDTSVLLSIDKSITVVDPLNSEVVFGRLDKTEVKHHFGKYTPDGKLIFVYFADFTLAVYSSRTFRRINQIALKNNITDLKFIPNTGNFITVSQSKVLAVWEIQTLRQIEAYQNFSSCATQFSSDGKLLATVNPQNYVLSVIDTETKVTLDTIQLTNCKFAMSANAKYIGVVTIAKDSNGDYTFSLYSNS